MEIRGGNFLYIYKGFKVLGAAIVPALIFAQSAAAAPANIYYQDATQQMVSANYQTALFQKNVMHDTNMYNALSTAFVNAENNPAASILITDDTTNQTIDWAAAYTKNETYANALIDASVNHAAIPTVDSVMGTDGTVTPVVAAVNVASVSAINGTVTATLSSAPTVAPVAGDFVVKQAINGAAPTTVTPTLVMNGAVATLTVAPVVATTVAQTVVYSVSYKTSDTVFANNVTVAGLPADKIAPVITAITSVNVTAAAQAYTFTVADEVNGSGVDASSIVVKQGTTSLVATAVVAQVNTYQVSLNEVIGANQNLTIDAKDKLGNVATQKSVTLVDKTAPYVAKITSLSATLVEVQFNENINAGLAQMPSNYALVETGTANLVPITGVTITGPNTVRLTTATQTDAKNYTLTVKSMQDSSANAISGSVSNTFVAIKDITKPTVVSAIATDANMIAVTLSEELNATTPVTATVKVYNTDGTLGTATIANTVVVTGNKAVVTLTASADYLQNAKTYNIVLTGGADLSTNPIADNQSKDFAGLRDTTAPTVVGQDYKNGVLTINFSEAVAANGTYGIYETNTGIPATIIAATPSTDKKSVALSFSPALTSVTSYSVRINDLTDVAITPNTIVTNTIVRFDTPAAPVTPVTLSSATQPGTPDGKSVVLTFNTALIKAEAENVNNYVIKQVADTTKTLGVTKAVYNATANTVTLTTAAQSEGVNYYEVTVSGLTSLDANSTKATFAGVDKVAASLTGVVAINEKTVDLTFSENLLPGQSVAPATTVSVVEKGTANVITANTISGIGNKLRITFAGTDATNTLVAGKTYTISVNNVKDTATPSNAATVQTIDVTAVADITAPLLTGVNVVNSGKIVLQFNEELSTQGAITNFTLKQGTTPVDISSGTATLSADGTQIIITGTTPQVFLTNGKAYTLTVAGGVADLKGNIVTNASYAFTGYEDVVNPKLLSAVANKDNKIVLTFDEAIGNAGAAGSYLVTNALTGEPLTVTDAAIGTVNTSTVELTLSTKTELGKQYRVYITGNAVIDAAVVGNPVDNTARVATFAGVDTTAPSIPTTTPTLTGVKTVKLTFDDVLSASSVTKEDFTVAGNTVSAASIDSTGKVVTLTLGTAVPTDKTTLAIGIAANQSVEDLSGNKLGGTSAVVISTTNLDKVAPTLVTAIKTATNQVTLTFSENIAVITSPDVSSIIAIDGYTVGTITATGTGNTVVVTTTADITNFPTTSLKVGQTAIKDIASNVYAGGDIVILK